MLREAGFSRYEISAYALPGNEARHNLNYWQFGDYLGIGAGAHGKLTATAGGEELAVRRTARPRQPRLYFEQADQRLRIHGRAGVLTKSLPSEFMMNALRLLGGVAESLYTERTGLPILQP